jgi:hypothetical protein
MDPTLNAALTLENQKRQIGEADATLPIFLVFDEQFVFESGPAVIASNTISSLAFVLDHPVNGLLDSNNLDGSISTTETYVINDRVDGYHKFFEHFREGSRIDTTNTTATMDYTTDYRAEFTAAQKVQSKIIGKEGLNIQMARAWFQYPALIFNFTFPATFGDNGNLAFQMSPDGTNWYTATYGQFVDMSSTPGQTLYYKATENASSTATMSYVQIDYKLSGES